MAARMDEATRRARIRARQWLRKRQEIDSGPHTRCACQHCVNILAEHERQTEARVRRETIDEAVDLLNTKMAALTTSSTQVKMGIRFTKILLHNMRTRRRTTAARRRR